MVLSFHLNANRLIVLFKILGKHEILLYNYFFCKLQVYQSLVSKRLEAGEDPFPITFCKRVPSKVYEKQKQGQELDTAMLNLLEQILFDVKMSMKEKKKKLKKFKESYPQIYYIRFPTEESEPDYMQTNQNGPITRMSSLAKLKNAIRM